MARSRWWSATSPSSWWRRRCARSGIFGGCWAGWAADGHALLNRKSNQKKGGVNARSNNPSGGGKGKTGKEGADAKSGTKVAGEGGGADCAQDRGKCGKTRELHGHPVQEERGHSPAI